MCKFYGLNAKSGLVPLGDDEHQAYAKAIMGAGELGFEMVIITHTQLLEIRMQMTLEIDSNPNPESEHDLEASTNC